MTRPTDPEARTKLARRIRELRDLVRWGQQKRVPGIGDVLLLIHILRGDARRLPKIPVAKPEEIS